MPLVTSSDGNRRKRPSSWFTIPMAALVLLVIPGMFFDVCAATEKDNLWISTQMHYSIANPGGALFNYLDNGNGVGGGIQVGHGKQFLRLQYCFQDLDIIDEFNVQESEDSVRFLQDFYFQEIALLLGGRTREFDGYRSRFFIDFGVAWGFETLKSQISSDQSIDPNNTTRNYPMIAINCGIVVRLIDNWGLDIAGFVREYRTGGGGSGYYDPGTGTYEPIYLPEGFEPADSEAARLTGFKIGLTYKIH